MIHDLDEFKNIPVDYDSPIKIVVNQMTDEIAMFTEDGVMQAVIKAGFDIDKDKLVSILQQDKERYQGAYREGYKSREDEIIHCRDCKYWHETIYDTPKWLPCMSVQTSGNWFCADGERKEE